MLPAEPTTSGAVRKVVRLDGCPTIAGFGDEDVAAVLKAEPRPETVSAAVLRLAPDGTERWRSDVLSVEGVQPGEVTTAGDDVIVRGWPRSIYASPQRVVRIAAGGRSAETVYDCIECNVRVFAGDAAGNVLVVARGERGDAQFVAARDGTRRPIESGLEVSIGGLDGLGHAVLAGTHLESGAMTIVKLPLDGGAASWSVPLPEGMVPREIGFSAMGTVVLTASASSWDTRVRGTWGDEPVPVGGAFLATIESDGRPRWIRPLPGGQPTHWSLAVLPSGRALVAAFDFMRMEAQMWNLAGSQLWVHRFPTFMEQTALRGFGAGGMALGEEHALLAFSFQGTYDFGTGPLESPSSCEGGVLVDLVP